MTRFSLGLVLAACLSPVAALAMQGDQSESGLCAELTQQEWYDADWDCALDGRGLALAAPNESAILAEALDQSVDNFEIYFGETDAKVAVIGAPVITQAEREFLVDAGYLVLPWVNEASKLNLLRASVERQVMEQTQALPEAQRQAVLAQALAKFEESRGGAAEVTAPSAIELGSLAHEAGHLLFTDFYDDGEVRANEQRQYGSTAPDWLDELAAVLNENEILTGSRYSVARENVADKGSALTYSLGEFLTMDHPSLNAARALQERATAGESRTIALSGEEAKKFLEQSGGDPVQFYVQSRLFADYLIEATQDQTVFVALSEVIASGGSFENWLTANHAEYGLAGDMDGFVAQWNDWISGRLAQSDAA